METWFLKDNDVYDRLKKSLESSKWPLIINVKQPKKKRSLDQNALYWSWINILAPHAGYSAEDLHDVLKVKFLGTKEITFRGEPILIAKSTTGLTTKEFTEYLDKVYALGGVLGVSLPSPNYWGYE
jgi:hypothetical protein